MFLRNVKNDYSKLTIRILLTFQIKLEANNVASLTQLSSTTILLLKRNFCQLQEDLKLVIKKNNNNNNFKELKKNNIRINKKKNKVENLKKRLYKSIFTKR